MRGAKPGEGPFDLDGAVQTRHDFGSEHPVTNTVVSTIASATEDTPFEMPPLYESVNPDALNTIIAAAQNASKHSETANLAVVFPHHDYVIGVSSDGRIAILDQVDGANTRIEDILAIDFSTDIHTVQHEWDSNTSLAATVVRAIASVTGLEPSAVHDRLYAVVDLHALDALFQPKADSTPRPNSGVKFSFQEYEVAVLKDGTIALQSTLARLKQTGGNLLLVGAVPDDVITAASAPLLGRPELSRARLFTLYETGIETAHERLSQAGVTRPEAHIITCQTGTRSTTAVPSRASDLRISDISGELDELLAAISDTIATIDRVRNGLAPAELRFSFDSLEALLQDHDLAAVMAFLESACDAINRVSGMGHYVLSVDRTADAIQALEPLFDAVIELRVGGDGPEQRWHLQTTGYTTEWFPLEMMQ